MRRDLELPKMVLPVVAEHLLASWDAILANCRRGGALSFPMNLLFALGHSDLALKDSGTA